MNPLRGSFQIHHMYRAVAAPMVALKDLFWIADRYWHCVLLRRLPPLTLFVIATFHMFEQCLRPCQGSVLFLRQLSFLGSYESLFQKQFCHKSSRRVPWRNNLSPEILRSVTNYSTVSDSAACSVKIQDCISVAHDSQSLKIRLELLLIVLSNIARSVGNASLFLATPYQQITTLFFLFLCNERITEHEFHVLL